MRGFIAQRPTRALSCTTRIMTTEGIDMHGSERQNAGTEFDSSEASGIRTRQLCGFFVPGLQSMAGRATDTTPRKGKEVHRLASAINLPATSRDRVIAAPRDFNLSKETAMHAIILAVRDGSITTTSNQIAEHFGKRHNDVMRAVRNLDCSPEFRLRNFAQSSYLNEQGKEQPAYTITRDGFVFLAMGFTGKDAAQWKEAYIGAFNAMEAELRAPKVGAGETAKGPKLLPAPDKLTKNLKSRINRIGTCHHPCLPARP